MRWKILAKKTDKNILDVLLENRGIKDKQEFLNPKHPEKLTSLVLGIDKKEIKKAIQIIKKAVKNQEKIVIYGDYDPDGVCATAIMWEAINSIGGNVMPFIPSREEGYGLKSEKLEELAKEEVKLIITVDQGIVHNDQVKQARKLGMKIVVTDHHVPGQKMPKADAVVHTTKIAGCAVAWFLAKELTKQTSGLDLACIGSITDIIPMLGPNRCIVKYGLPIVSRTKRPGLKALIELAGITKKELTTYDIGFLIGPRLNAVGRLEDPMDSLRLICTNNKKRAEDLAKKINQHNQTRQVMMEKATIKAREDWLTDDGKSSLIFVASSEFHIGIIGLVASRLVDEFYRPVVILSESEKESKASARSIEGFNIIEAVRSCSDLLIGHGGHPKAAGFIVETSKIELVKSRLIAFAKDKLSLETLTPVLKIDLELKLVDLNLDLWNQINTLQPFGEGNREPVFVSRDLKIEDVRLMGKDKQHLQLQLGDGLGNSMRAVGFNMGSNFGKLKPNEKIEVVYNLILNEWNGKSSLQLKLKDLKQINS